MAGIDRETGKPLEGLAHALQSLRVIFTTRKKTRVMRRAFGSDLPRLVDRALNPLTLIEFYAAMAESATEEPRIRILRAKLSEEDSDLPNGNPVFDTVGLFYPRGHLGDFSEVHDFSGKLVL